jgi:tRNA-dihydrouridine synthase 1
LVVQFCAKDPETLLAAAKLVEDKCDAVDINLGCPQRCAKKGHYGAFLLEQPDLVYRMGNMNLLARNTKRTLVRTLAQNLKIPVYCKIRILPTEEATLKLAKGIEDAGAQVN